MHHDMLRADQALSRERCLEILEEGLYGTLALCGQDGVPYAVPLNYALGENKIWFHCGTKGRKLEILGENPMASFCVVGCAENVPEKFTTRYESVIVTGRAKLLETREEKLAAMIPFCKKYSPAFMDRLSCIRGDLKSLNMVELEILDMSGKRSRD